MRRENFSVALALVLILRLEMGGAIGEGLQARAATRDSAATAAPVVLDVIATDRRAHGPAEGLTQDDFEIVEGQSVAHITSIAHGSEGSVRPLSLWLVVQYPEERSYSNWVSNGSGFMQGKTATLAPVLKKLNERDTVGVAHWCDNGEVVDPLSSSDRVAPQNVLDAVLNATRTNVAGTPGVNALHNTVIRVRDSARRLTPNGQPVMIFFTLITAGCTTIKRKICWTSRWELRRLFWHQQRDGFCPPLTRKRQVRAEVCVALSSG